MRTLWGCALLLFVLSACATTAQTGHDVITVEGTATVRGAEPFTAVVLETANRNSYVLSLTPGQREALSAPSRIRVTGHLRTGEWRGMVYAHLDVIDWVLLDE